MSLKPLIAIDTELLDHLLAGVQALSQVLSGLQTADTLNVGTLGARGATAEQASAREIPGVKTSAAEVKNDPQPASTGKPSSPAATQAQGEAGAGAATAEKSSSADAGNDSASSVSTADATQSVPAAQKTATGSTAPASGMPADAPVLTYEDVTKATLALAAARGRDAAVAVLNTFGVDHGSKLTQDQWAPYIAAATAAREPELA